MCFLGLATLSFKPTCQIPKLKGVDYMTSKAPCSMERLLWSLPVSWVQKRKALCLEEPHGKMGLVLFGCQTFTAEPMNICITCHMWIYCLRVPQRKMRICLLRKMICLRQGFTPNRIPYYLGLMGGGRVRQVLNEK